MNFRASALGTFCLLVACGQDAATSNGGGGCTSTGNAGTTGNSGGSAGQVSTSGGSAGAVTTSGTGGTTSGGTGGSGGSTTAGTGGAAGSGGTTAAAGDIYVSPDGNNNNPGTDALPIKDLSIAHQRIQPGYTIWIKGGTHLYPVTTDITRNGTPATPFKIYAVAGTRPVLDYSSVAAGGRGILLRGDWWHIKGLEIKNAPDNAIMIWGAHNKVEDIVVHDNGDTGIQLTRDDSMAGDDTRSAYNEIINCDSYQNWDAPSGEDADGFAAKLSIGPGNVFRGCRAWNNSDDGWDLYGADQVVTIENCWAFGNGNVSQSNPDGDGNGFKLGGKPPPGEGYASHIVTGCAAFDNEACGFTLNNNTADPVLSDCAVGSNGNGDYCDGASCSNDSSTSMTTSQGIAAQRDSNGDLPAL